MRAVVLCALCFALVFPSSPAQSRETDTVQLVGFQYPPFYQQGVEGEEGIAMDLAQEVFSRLGVAPEIEIYPLKRALSLLERGEADGTMILIKTPERSRYLHFSEPVMVVRGLIWSAVGREGGAVTFDDLTDLRPYKIGVTRGYSYGPEFDELLETMDVEVANTDYHNYLMLLSRRIDIFPGNEIVAEGLFKTHPELRGKFTHSDNSFMEWTLRIAISKRSPLADKLPAINRILSELKSEGRVDEIVRKYTMQEPETPAPQPH